MSFPWVTEFSLYRLGCCLRGDLPDTFQTYSIADNEKTGPYDEVFSLEFSPDGKTLAYVAKIDGKWHIMVGNEKFGPYDDYIWFLNFPLTEKYWSMEQKLMSSLDHTCSWKDKNILALFVMTLFLYKKQGNICKNR